MVHPKVALIQNETVTVTEKECSTKVLVPTLIMTKYNPFFIKVLCVALNYYKQ